MTSSISFSSASNTVGAAASAASGQNAVIQAIAAQHLPLPAAQGFGPPQHAPLFTPPPPPHHPVIHAQPLGLLQPVVLFLNPEEPMEG